MKRSKTFAILNIEIKFPIFWLIMEYLIYNFLEIMLTLLIY
jgi:hypothetical protein